MRGSVDTAGPEHAAEWDRFVAGHPEAAIYHLYAWRDFYERDFGKEAHYLIARNDAGTIDGVLPLVRQKSVLFGDYLCSVPYFNYGGTLADGPDARRRLFEAAARLCDTLGARHLELRETGDYDNWPTRVDKMTMLLPLPTSSDELGQALGSKLRSQIRRPQRENPETRVGGTELLDDFYAVFSRNMRDLGTPVYSRRMFRVILERFAKNAELITIDVAGRPAAAAFLMHHRGTTEIPWASTVRDYNAISINMLLYWEALNRAIERGSRSFDFGRSTIDSGTYRFKKQWGAQPRQLYWHYHVRDGGEMPALNPGSGRYDLAMRVWRSLPLWVANSIGPLLVHDLP